MNWPDVFLFSFVVGFCLSLLSFFGGVLHLPHVHFHGHGQGDAALFPAAMAFLTWFGGAGYLITRYSGFPAILAIAAALAIGAAGSFFIFRLLGRVMGDEQPLSPGDFRMIGVLGKISSPVREGGTGEMIFSLQGARRGVPVRSENCAPIERGTEVVVTRFEKGIAYVKLWSEWIS